MPDWISCILIIKVLFLLFLCCGISFIFGCAAAGLFRISFYYFEVLSVGFTVLLGMLELFAWPIAAFRLSWIWFYIVLGIVITIGMILGIYYLITSSKQLFFDQKGRKKEKIRRAIDVAAIGMSMILLIVLVFYFKSDADDSFYVSNVNLFVHSPVINLYDSSFGIPELGTVPMYDFQIWETLAAFLCKLTGIEAIVMMHTAIVPILLLMHISAIFLMGRVLHNQENASLYFLMITVYHLWCGFSGYSDGAFLIGRLWQGKSVYLNIVLPVLVCAILCFYELQTRWLWLQLLLIMAAGVALNPTSMYVMGFEMIFLSAAGALTKKEIRVLLHLLPAVCLVFAFTGMIYLRSRTFSGQIEAAQRIERGFILNTFRNMWGTGVGYLLLFVIACIIIICVGNPIHRVYYLLTPLLLLVFVWNPLTGPLIAEHITMVPSFWRVFWLLPAGQAVVSAGILLFEKAEGLLRIAFLFIMTVMLIIPGKWILKLEAAGSKFLLAQNAEKVHPDLLYFGDEIQKRKPDATVLGCAYFSSALRQKYSDIELIYSREQYVKDLFLYRGKETEANDRLFMMRFVNNDSVDANRLKILLEKYNVDFIIIENSSLLASEVINKDIEWTVVKQLDDYTMYSVE